VSKARRQRQAQRQAQQKAAAGSERFEFPRETAWTSAGLVLLVAAAYAAVARFGFTRFDDPTYVTENPYIAGGLSANAVKWALTSGYAANWHPLTWISHMLDVQLFGLDAGPHHVVNVALHAASTVLLFTVLLRMSGALWPSAFVAGLFGLHPIHVESVAWVAERKDVLSAFFWMLTLWAYAEYARRPRRGAYLAVVVLFALGLMAKPMVVTLPFALLLLDVWPLERVKGSTWRSLVLEKAPLFAMSAASGLITVAVQGRGGTVASGVVLPLGGRIANALTAYVAYLAKTFWPAHLAAYYPYPSSIQVARVAGSLILLGALTALAVRLARRHPYVPVGWFWYLGTLVPAIGLIQVGTQAMADRYTYIPLIGIFIVLAWGVPELVARWPRSRVALLGAAAVALLACTAATRAQVRHWSDSKALWTHALRVTKENYAAHTYMGNALSLEGDLEGAIDQYEEALRIRPDYPEAHNNLGPALARTGRLDEAVASFTEAVRLRPNFADAHSNLGLALASQGKLDEAIAQYQEALRLSPEHASARGNLGFALQAQGRIPEAVREFELVLRLNPNNQSVRDALAALQTPGQPSP
jgi:protein O-mannosyl-transferase